MYINPFLAGVLVTIGTELLLTVAAALIITTRSNNDGHDD